MVLGYVIMRVPMVAMWMRASRQDPDRRRSARVYIVSIVVSQLVWCVLDEGRELVLEFRHRSCAIVKQVEYLPLPA